jgi:hypothetical protein
VGKGAKRPCDRWAQAREETRGPGSNRPQPMMGEQLPQGGRAARLVGLRQRPRARNQSAHYAALYIGRVGDPAIHREACVRWSRWDASMCEPKSVPVTAKDPVRELGHFWDTVGPPYLIRH